MSPREVTQVVGVEVRVLVSLVSLETGLQVSLTFKSRRLLCTRRLSSTRLGVCSSSISVNRSPRRTQTEDIKYSVPSTCHNYRYRKKSPYTLRGKECKDTSVLSFN